MQHTSYALMPRITMPPGLGNHFAASAYDWHTICNTVTVVGHLYQDLIKVDINYCLRKVSRQKNPNPHIKRWFSDFPLSMEHQRGVCLLS